METKAIFLDLGGTFREVVEIPEVYNKARARIAEICQTDMDPDTYWAFINKRYDVYREWALRFLCEAPEKLLWTRWLVPELDRDYVEAHAVELTENFRLAKGDRQVVPHGLETVRELRRRGYKVGIISDLVGPVEIDKWLDRAGIRDLFCTVKQSSVTLLRKPHPAIYFQALDEAGVRGEESVFVGDNLNRDIIGAKAAGFGGTVSVEYPGKRLKLTQENVPDCIIHDFADLLNVFPGNGEFHPENAERRDP